MTEGTPDEMITALDDMDIKMEIGNLQINILYLRMAPFAGGTYIPPHSHSGYELHFIYQGKGRVKVDRSVYELTPSTFYLTGPDVIHEQSADINDPMKEYCINFEVTRIGKSTPGHLNDAADMTVISEALLNTKFWHGIDNHDNSGIFGRILEEANERGIGYCLSIRNYITQILINVSRSYLGNRRSSGDYPQKHIDDRRRLVIDLYMQSYSRKLTIADLAGRIGLSIRQTNRMLLKYYGMPFCRRLNSIRIRMAAMMLEQQDMKISDIAESAGFDDTVYFCRTFRKFTGMTPSDHRKQHGDRSFRE